MCWVLYFAVSGVDLTCESWKFVCHFLIGGSDKSCENRASWCAESCFLLCQELIWRVNRENLCVTSWLGEVTSRVRILLVDVPSIVLWCFRTHAWKFNCPPIFSELYTQSRTPILLQTLPRSHYACCWCHWYDSKTNVAHNAAGPSHGPLVWCNVPWLQKTY